MPGSAPGCTIFVKLWQFDPADRTHVRIDTGKMPYLPAPNRNNVIIMPLFADGREEVRLERWGAGAEIALSLPGGGEFLVLAGSFEEGGETLVPQSWLRLPAGTTLSAEAGAEGCELWVKTGHLRFPPTLPIGN
jgi:hypothetical protein